MTLLILDNSETYFSDLSEVSNSQIFFSIKLPLRVLNRGRNVIKLEINWGNCSKFTYFLVNTNLCKPADSVNSKPPKKKKLTPSEQAKIFRRLLDSGKVKNKAAIARNFGVRQAWVTMILS